MKLFIMRHGSAEAFMKVDQDRCLTDFGIDEVRQMAAWLKRHAEDFDHVLISPFIRAKQTAETLENEGVKFLSQEFSHEITPSGSAEIAWEYLQVLMEQKNYRNLLVVSHMPFVSYLVERVTKGQDAPIFATAGIAEIAIDEEISKLVSLVSPASL